MGKTRVGAKTGDGEGTEEVKVGERLPPHVRSPPTFQPPRLRLRQKGLRRRVACIKNSKTFVKGPAATDDGRPSEVLAFDHCSVTTALVGYVKLMKLMSVTTARLSAVYESLIANVSGEYAIHQQVDRLRQSRRRHIKNKQKEANRPQIPPPVRQPVELL